MSEHETSTMRSLGVEKYGKPQDYKILQLPVPKIVASDELLIKVHAASINPIDVHTATGALKMVLPSTLPYKIGYDLSGTISAVGSNVPSHLNPGTEVYSRVSGHHRGTISEYALSTVSVTAIKPSSVSHVQAASIPLAALTALQSVDVAEKHFDNGLKGKTVYIPGGLSGTGSIGIQLAKNCFGAGRVITTLSTSKITKVESLLGEGVVDQIIDYTKEDPTKAIPEGSVDFLFDTMNVAMASLHLMKKGGLIVTVSSLPFGPELKTGIPDMPVIIRWILNGIGAFSQYRVGRYGVDYHWLGMHGSTDDLNRLSKWIDEGKVKPVVGRVSKLDNLNEVREGCQEVLDKKGGTGKFVIEI